MKCVKYCGDKYDKDRTFKEWRQDPTSNETCVHNQELKAIVQHSVNDIILHATEKLNVSVKNETHVQ